MRSRLSLPLLAFTLLCGCHNKPVDNTDIVRKPTILNSFDCRQNRLKGISELPLLDSLRRINGYDYTYNYMDYLLSCDTFFLPDIEYQIERERAIVNFDKRHLAKLHETALNNLPIGTDAFRVIISNWSSWFIFDTIHPEMEVLVTIIKCGNQVTLRKERVYYSGILGLVKDIDTNKLVYDTMYKEKILTREDFYNVVKMTDDVSFWDLSQDKHYDLLHNDGAVTWIFEGGSKNSFGSIFHPYTRFHRVVRLDPEEGNDFKKLCIYLLQLADDPKFLKLAREPVRVYSF